MVKKILLAFALALVVANSTALAQQKEPLAMRVMVDWSLAGTFGGLGFGVAVWLTDPGRPGNKLSEQMAGGAAWGAVAGAAYGIVILNQTMRRPGFANLSPGALHPASRITSDPIGAASKREDLFASTTNVQSGWGDISLPVLNFKF